MAIEKCVCNHEFQDKEYGKGRRVFNEMQSRENTFRCTVCGREREIAKRIPVSVPKPEESTDE